MLNEVKNLTSGNCLPLEQVKILHVTSATRVNSVEVLNWTSAGRTLIEDGEDVGRGNDDLLDHDYLPDPRHISERSQRTVLYIAGVLAWFLLQKLRCTECVVTLAAAPDRDPAHSLMQQKTAEDLPCPSVDALEVYRECEINLRATLRQSSTASRSFVEKMLCNILERFLGKDVFSSLNDHMLQNEPMENHTYHLMGSVAQNYLDIRLQTISMVSTD